MLCFTFSIANDKDITFCNVGSYDCTMIFKVRGVYTVCFEKPIIFHLISIIQTAIKAMTVS